MANLIQKLIVEDPSEASSILPQRVALVTPDGEPWAPEGGVPSDGSITAGKLAADAVETEKIKDGAVTKAKLGSDVVIPEKYTLPAAKTNALGGVKQAAHVASAAGENVTKAEFEALLDSLEAAGIVASA